MRGTFERADGGTLLLDEVGELPLELQPKLLRVLETKTIRRLGEEKVRAVDVRALAVTNRELVDAVAAGTFRQDLFFRLNLVTIHVPPLRERREDIPVLVRAFLAASGDADVTLEPATLELFTSGYDWPGNVRELRHAVVRLRTLGTMPDELRGGRRQTGGGALVAIDEEATYRESKRAIVEAVERDFLRAKLAQTGGNISRAARLAGMERTQLKRLARKHGLLRGEDASGDD